MAIEREGERQIERVGREREREKGKAKAEKQTEKNSAHVYWRQRERGRNTVENIQFCNADTVKVLASFIH